jgi:hypothetical protein
MVNSPAGPGGGAWIPEPGYSVKVRTTEEYRQFTRPFLPPACALVAPLQEMPHEDLQPIAEFPLVTTSQALYLLCQVGKIEAMCLLVAS